ncbi:MAG: hypothetical protein Q4G59_06420, partial [Planctomycetia bacterium]|nr:hypothetical protein [Planctomycetia bacterium]
MSILSRIFGGKKAVSQSKGVKRLANRGLKLELLEDRQLLSASDISPTGWNLMVEGDDNGYSSTSDVSPIASLNFGYQPEAGRATFGFVVAAQKTPDNAFKPGTISILDNATGNTIAPIATQYSQDKSIVLVTLNPSADGYTINVTSSGTNYGQFMCEVYLPGDSNGDGIVSTDEVRGTKGAFTATGLDPWVSTFQDQFGHDKDWFLQNVPLFDHNLDGIMSADDINIATENGTTSQATGNMADKVNLNADQKAPEVVVPENEGDGPYYEPTFDEDGNLEELDIYSTDPEAPIITFTDDNPIASVTIDGQTFDVPADRNHKNEETGLWEVEITGEDFQPGGIFEDAIISPNTPENFTFDEVFATDSYDNAEDPFKLHYEFETTATIPVVGTETVNGTEKPNAEKLFLYTGNLQYSVSTEAGALIQITDGAAGKFKTVTDEVLEEVAGEYKVVYSLTEDGAITLKLVNLGTGTLDPYAWLSTAVANSGDNQKVFNLPFTVANIYHMNFENGATPETMYWQNGTLDVNLAPMNDSPVAANTAVYTIVQGTPGTVDVLGSVTDKDDWDDLSVTSVAGKDGVANAFTSGTISGGTYDGMEYADIDVSTSEGDKTIRVINDTTQVYTIPTAKGVHNMASKLVVDLLGNFDFLRIDAELGFSFTYTASDKAGATNGATANVTAKGINDQPVAGDVTEEATETVTDENTATTYTLDSEVSDPDTFPTDEETYKVNMATTAPTWTCN